MTTVAIILMIVNTVLSASLAVLAWRKVRATSPEIRSISGQGAVALGLVAQLWLSLAVIESVMFLFAPYPAPLVPVWISIELGCVVAIVFYLIVVFRMRIRGAFMADIWAMIILGSDLGAVNRLPDSSLPFWMYLMFAIPLLCVMYLALILMLIEFGRVRRASNRVAEPARE